MDRDTLEWELRQLESGTELLVSDARKHPIARGVLRDDRKGLSGQNGEYFPFDRWESGWELTVMRHEHSEPRDRSAARH
jgi:hypothetical protein